METKPFMVDERVRWSDVDYAGIIFYGAYFRFFELAEMELFREAGVPYSDVFERFDIWLPRVHLDCDFMAFSALFPDRCPIVLSDLIEEECNRDAASRNQRA